MMLPPVARVTRGGECELAHASRKSPNSNLRARPPACPCLPGTEASRGAPGAASHPVIESTEGDLHEPSRDGSAPCRSGAGGRCLDPSATTPTRASSRRPRARPPDTAGSAHATAKPCSPVTRSSPATASSRVTASTPPRPSCGPSPRETSRRRSPSSTPGTPTCTSSGSPSGPRARRWKPSRRRPGRHRTPATPPHLRIGEVAARLGVRTSAPRRTRRPARDGQPRRAPRGHRRAPRGPHRALVRAQRTLT